MKRMMLLVTLFVFGNYACAAEKNDSLAKRYLEKATTLCSDKKSLAKVALYSVVGAAALYTTQDLVRGAIRNTRYWGILDTLTKTRYPSNLFINLATVAAAGLGVYDNVRQDKLEAAPKL